MLPAGTVCSQTVALRVAAQVKRARQSWGGATPTSEADQDYLTALLAERIEREMSRVPKLRPEQVAALRAIIAGADVPTTIADVVQVAPAAITAA